MDPTGGSVIRIGGSRVSKSVYVFDDASLFPLLKLVLGFDVSNTPVPR